MTGADQELLVSIVATSAVLLFAAYIEPKVRKRFSRAWAALISFVIAALTVTALVFFGFLIIMLMEGINN